MKKFFLAITVILILAGLFYYAYPIIKNRYFSEPEKELKTEESTIKNDSQIKEEGIKTDEAAGENGLEGGEEKVENNIASPSGKTFDCADECADLEGGDLTYCQQVCGLTPVKENIENCDQVEGLEKDYCLKDLAISKKDFKICEEIKDKKIKETCKNRVTEEILEDRPRVE